MNKSKEIFIKQSLVNGQIKEIFLSFGVFGLLFQKKEANLPKCLTRRQKSEKMAMFCVVNGAKLTTRENETKKCCFSLCQLKPECPGPSFPFYSWICLQGFRHFPQTMKRHVDLLILVLSWKKNWNFFYENASIGFLATIFHIYYVVGCRVL